MIRSRHMRKNTPSIRAEETSKPVMNTDFCLSVWINADTKNAPKPNNIQHKKVPGISRNILSKLKEYAMKPMRSPSIHFFLP